MNSYHHLGLYALILAAGAGCGGVALWAKPVATVPVASDTAVNMPAVPGRAPPTSADMIAMRTAWWIDGEQLGQVRVTLYRRYGFHPLDELVVEVRRVIPAPSSSDVFDAIETLTARRLDAPGNFDVVEDFDVVMADTTHAKITLHLLERDLATRKTVEVVVDVRGDAQ
jgi:hypothetical protein